MALPHHDQKPPPYAILPQLNSPSNRPFYFLTASDSFSSPVLSPLSSEPLQSVFPLSSSPENCEAPLPHTCWPHDSRIPLILNSPKTSLATTQREQYWKTVMISTEKTKFHYRADRIGKDHRPPALRYHCKVAGCTQIFRHRSSRSRHQKKFHPTPSV